MAVEVISPYEYTPEQADVLRLHELYRRCLLNQKYFSWKLGRYKFWDQIANVVTALSTSSSVAGLTIWKTGHGIAAFTILGSIGALIQVIRPFFKPSENIERCSTLHYGFTELFYQIENLLAEIRRNNGVAEQHRRTADEITERFKNLAMQEGTEDNRRKISELQDEVDQAIPGKSLWLPG